jgi:hypothetical protein
MNLLKIVTVETGSIARALRRRWYIHFKQDYVNKQIEKRRGVCGHHGCCDLSLLHRLYNKYYKKCLNQNDRRACLLRKKLPRECQVYPLDEKDKIPETKSYCNFYWHDSVTRRQKIR